MPRKTAEERQDARLGRQDAKQQKKADAKASQQQYAADPYAFWMAQLASQREATQQAAAEQQRKKDAKVAAQTARKTAVQDARASGQRGKAVKQAGRSAAQDARQTAMQPQPPPEQQPPSMIPADQNDGAPPGVPDWVNLLIGSFQPQQPAVPPGYELRPVGDPGAAQQPAAPEQPREFAGEGNGYLDNVQQGQQLTAQEKSNAA